MGDWVRRFNEAKVLSNTTEVVSTPRKVIKGAKPIRHNGYSVWLEFPSLTEFVNKQLNIKIPFNPHITLLYGPRLNKISEDKLKIHLENLSKKLELCYGSEWDSLTLEMYQTEKK
eukprot:UN27301